MDQPSHFNWPSGLEQWRGTIQRGVIKGADLWNGSTSAPSVLVSGTRTSSTWNRRVKKVLTNKWENVGSETTPATSILKDGLSVAKTCLGALMLDILAFPS